MQGLVMEHCFANPIPGLLTNKECNQVLRHIPKLSASRVLRADGTPARTFGRTCSDGWLFRDESTTWLFDRFMAAAELLNNAHYGYDISEIRALQVLRYRPLQRFDAHFDSNNEHVRRRKLTIVCQLSKPSDYLGGRLKVYGSPYSRYFSKAQGDGMIFPSHAYHAARPVLFGTRYALVAWVEGEPLR